MHSHHKHLIRASIGLTALVPTFLFAQSYVQTETNTSEIEVTSTSNSTDPGSVMRSTEVRVTTPEGTFGEIRTTDAGGTTVTPIHLPGDISALSLPSITPVTIEPTIDQSFDFSATSTLPATLDVQHPSNMADLIQKHVEHQVAAGFQNVDPVPTLDLQGIAPMEPSDRWMDPTMHDEEHFFAHATGNQEVPMVETDGYGIGRFSLKADGLHYTIEVFDISSPITAAHFHRGVPGESGPVVAPINMQGSTATGVWALSAEERAQVERGEIYVNIHTSNYPDGEIRGQVLQF